ncbi:NADH-quinone oxidoreductase subunit C [Catenuloplanes nepalensis]|uniref:NADH-quinone oxidoreductase n=1 Tax=Catenuloplanes nepalensis TaxID=587533 RepID=A0ABT9N5Z4_9ACTN|nr:NADH-quinone oxidoreductase subunit C [Catenuloplanes nepalensis]MDP9799099.1 NADH-quinone oxidoreductase subunit C [Catenuloplanes nepalensis]
MTPEEVGTRLISQLGDAEASVSAGDAFARATVDVPPGRWWAACQAAASPAGLACDFFDWLSAVDELDGGFAVVAHLWSTRRRDGVLIRTRVPRDTPELESIVGLYPGAAWHERETFEMFGIGFTGHDDLKPLLLPPEFEGHPLRKDFVLASRVAKPWPGAKEPGEAAAGGGKRAPMRPPGVPDPNEWGPQAGRLPERPERPARPDRPARPARGAGSARPAVPGTMPVPEPPPIAEPETDGTGA